MITTDLKFHDETQAFELGYWGDCCNTIYEELKHYVYARLMDIPVVNQTAFDARHKSVLDVGGGPVSMLLKAVNLNEGHVVDPMPMNAWVRMRYETKDIGLTERPAEEMEEAAWDEVWMYNCLQHVRDPLEVIRRAYRAAPVIRLFEWIDLPPHPGHPHMLSADGLGRALGWRGETAWLNESGCHGNAFFGVFHR